MDFSAPDSADASDLLERFRLLIARAGEQGPSVLTKLTGLLCALEALLQANLSDKMDTSAGGRLAHLLTINKQISAELDVNKLLCLIIDTAVSLTGAEQGFLILYPRKEPEYRVARTADKQDIASPHQAVSRAILQQVLDSRDIVVAKDAAQDSRFGGSESVMYLQLKSVLAVPLMAQDTMTGIIYLDHSYDRSIFNESCITIIRAFADQAVIALNNAFLHDQLRQRNEALEASRRTISRLHSALEQRFQEQQEKLADTEEALSRTKAALGQRYRYGNIIGRSPQMQQVYHLLERIANADTSVLIQGASGTGKELIARALHFNSLWRDKPFISENCAAFNESLLESDLFGHVKGAFTHAIQDRQGLFELADTGTLFLDEIGDMTLNMQVKVLRVLQSGEFRRVGDKQVRNTRFRLICATNQDLEQLVARGRFRKDLYFRINVIKVTLPELKERIQDLPLLVEHFLAQYERPYTMEPATLSRLMKYHWPGNVRELENETQRMITLAQSTALTPDLLSPHILQPTRPAGACGTLKAQVEVLERRVISESLARTGGNKSETARELGISREGLRKKMARYGM